MFSFWLSPTLTPGTFPHVPLDENTKMTWQLLSLSGTGTQIPAVCSGPGSHLPCLRGSYAKDLVTGLWYQQRWHSARVGKVIRAMPLEGKWRPSPFSVSVYQRPRSQSVKGIVSKVNLFSSEGDFLGQSSRQGQDDNTPLILFNIFASFPLW